MQVYMVELWDEDDGSELVGLALTPDGAKKIARDHYRRRYKDWHPRSCPGFLVRFQPVGQCEEDAHLVYYVQSVDVYEG